MDEPKNLDVEKSSGDNHGDVCGGRLHSRISLPRTRKLLEIVSTLKIPLMIACIFVELAVFLPYFITLIAQHKALGIIGLITSQSPIIYYMLKSFLRRSTLVIDERGETRDTTKIDEKVNAYVDSLNEKE